MNHAHNNLRIKSLQFKIEKAVNFLKGLTPDKDEVRLEVKG